MDKIIITTFTDPMMGLTYECEPTYDKLKAHYGDDLELKYVMAGLVRDVSDFMTPEEFALPAREGIQKYNKRLAGIYKSEESIGGLPINMNGFHLFDENHRSSYPLNIAYKAAQLVDDQKADLFLYNLRHATVLETRQTTLTSEIINVVKDTGIDATLFMEHFSNGSAEANFLQDLKYTRSLGIYSLPSYLIQKGSHSVLITQLIDFETFESVIAKLG